MAEVNENKPVRRRRIRHTDRGNQVFIYLGKQFRFFVNENDWKVLPMAAIIAALVGMVINKNFCVNMEGCLFGGFALTCVAIWNGCFNSIQAVCRERAIIKREHRSGMHISSYVAAHMIYQLALCAAQTGLSLYVMTIMGVKLLTPGFMTSYMAVDIGISMLLISYASDMLSLFVSSISHTTTGAMTVMPFVLIFQLVFSGGLLPLPEWSETLSNYTISNYGLKAIASQSGYNEAPMVTGWNMLYGLRDQEISGTVTVGQLLDALDSPAVQRRSDTVLMDTLTVGDLTRAVAALDSDLHLSEKEIVLPSPSEDGGSLTLSVSDVLRALSAVGLTSALEEHADAVVSGPVTLGQVAELIRSSAYLQSKRDESFTFTATVNELFEIVGVDNLKEMVQRKTAEASQKPEYTRSVENIVDNWISLGLFVVVFALLSTLSLELIDRDKR